MHRFNTKDSENHKSIPVSLEQDFNIHNALNLNLSNSGNYNRPCGDRGIIVGRVSINNGFGVANAKVSVFIPISAEDRERPEIIRLYPFELISDTFDNGKPYNLLPRTKQSGVSHKPVGTFPHITDIQNYPVYKEVYDKYYKYTTTTNEAGDFMLYGVPLGLNNVHMDFDIFDTPSLDVTANDLVSNLLFTDTLPTDNSGIVDPDKIPNFNHLGSGDFEVQTKINHRDMPNIFSEDKLVNVTSFWGDPDICDIGITRVDFNIDYNFKPTAVFFGSFQFTSTDAYISANHRAVGFKDKYPMPTVEQSNPVANGIGPAKDMRIVVHRTDPEQGNKKGSISRFGVFKAIGLNTGVFKLHLPMYSDYYVTNEYGQIVPSTDEVGIPTSGRYAFEVYEYDEQRYGRVRLQDGLTKRLAAGFRVPASETGDRWLGGWHRTLKDTSELKYDIINVKKKYYTIKTTYRKHLSGDISVSGVGNRLDYLPKLPDTTDVEYSLDYNWPLSADNLSINDPATIIGSFYAPMMELRESYSEWDVNDLQTKIPNRLTTTPWVSKQDANNVVLKPHEYMLGIGVTEGGSNDTGIFSEYYTRTQIKEHGQKDTYYFGDNPKDGNNPPVVHTYAQLLASKSGSDDINGVHKPYNSVVYDDGKTFGLFISSNNLNNNNVLATVDIHDITNDLPKLISDSVYSSFNKGDDNNQHAYNGSYYWFGQYGDTNALRVLEKTLKNG